MRNIGLVIVPLLASVQLVRAECVSLSSIREDQKLEIVFKEHNTDVSIESVHRISKRRNYDLTVLETRENKSREGKTFYSEDSILGIFALKSVYKKYLQDTGKIRRIINYDIDNSKIGTMLLSQERFSYNLNQRYGDYYSSDSIQKNANWKYSGNVVGIGNSNITINNCKISTNIIETSEKLIDTNLSAQKKYIGNVEKMRYHFANSLMYPVLIQRFNKDKWIDVRTAVAVRAAI